MREISCNWVEDHLDEYLAEELSEERRAMVRVHLAVCDSCAESLRLWSGLEVAARRADIRPLPPLIERRLVSGNVPEPIETARRSSRRPLLIAAAVSAAAAAAIAVLLVLPDTAPGGISPEEPLAQGPPDLVEPPLPDGPLLAAPPEAASSGRRVISVSPGTALWLGDDTVVDVEVLDESEARFRIEQGFAVAEIGPVDPGFRFVVHTPDGEVEARGTVFSVEVGSTGRTRVRVAEGEVEIRRKGRAAQARVLTAGLEAETASEAHRAASADALAADLAFLFEPVEPPSVAAAPSPDPQDAAGAPIAARGSGRGPGPAGSGEEPAAERASDTRTPGAEEIEEPTADSTVSLEDESGHTPESMVKLAQAYRSRRMFSAAARTYERLVTKFPGSPSAANALVALGQLELTNLAEPGAALEHFAAYLDRSPSGPLAAEARAGRARSLARLGRVSQLKSAARDYLASHPEGRAAAEMHRRLGDAHARTGDCERAADEYRTVLERWPSSPEARRARAGLDSCEDVP
jgi:ferric-dicitrate binding protein FerR (iron transport regulator)